MISKKVYGSGEYSTDTHPHEFQCVMNSKRNEIYPYKTFCFFGRNDNEIVIVYLATTTYNNCLAKKGKNMQPTENERIINGGYTRKAWIFSFSM